jgi:hypothetical protein
MLVPASSARPSMGNGETRDATHTWNTGNTRPVHFGHLRRRHGRPSSFLLGLNQPENCVELLTATPRQSWANLSHLRGGAVLPAQLRVTPSFRPDFPAKGPGMRVPGHLGAGFPLFPLPARNGPFTPPPGRIPPPRPRDGPFPPIWRETNGPKAIPPFQPAVPSSLPGRRQAALPHSGGLSMSAGGIPPLRARRRDCERSEHNLIFIL